MRPIHRLTRTEASRWWIFAQRAHELGTDIVVVADGAPGCAVVGDSERWIAEPAGIRRWRRLR